MARLVRTGMDNGRAIQESGRVRATSRPAILAGAFAVAASLVGAAPEIASAAVPQPIGMPDPILGIAARADNGVSVVMSPLAGVYETSVVPAGGAGGGGIGVQLPGKHPTTSYGFAPDGSVVFATWHPTHGRLGTMAVVDAVPMDAASAPIPLSGFGPTALPDSVTVGPTGAVAITSTRTSTSGAIPTLVFKPANTSTYGRGLALGPPLGPRKANVRTVVTNVVLGPDGGGAVLVQRVGRASTPAPVIHRITPDGHLGRAIAVPIGSHFMTTASLAMAPSGTIAMLFDEDDAAPGKPERNRVVLTTLPPGATATTVPQDFGISTSPALGGADVAIAIGAGDQTAILAGPGNGGLRAFTGPLTALVARTPIPAKRPIDARVVVGPDGSPTAVWTGVDAGQGPDTIVTAHAPVDGAFAAPVTQTDYVKAGTSLLISGGPVAMPDGTVTIGYARDSGFSNNLIRFTP